MTEIPAKLAEVLKSNDWRGVRTFVLLYRNEWNEVTGKYTPEDTPIDITDMLVKPNTLSMTLDVNEIAQYNTNNVTLTLEDVHNRLAEGTPETFFTEGYQLYGSRVNLYVGLDMDTKTPLFTGVIRDWPTYKTESYQVDLKLVSPLELLNNIEAKEFSDKYTGETLTLDHTDSSSGHPFYRTAHTGVGGFDAVYAGDVKLYEGVDYKISQTSELGLPAMVEIINTSYQNKTITADYYVWKKGLTVEQVVSGLAALAGYDSGTEDIRDVSWNTLVRTSVSPTPLFSLGYALDGKYAGLGSYSWGAAVPPATSWNSYLSGKNHFPENFLYSLTLAPGNNNSVMLGEVGQSEDYPTLTTLLNGFVITNTNQRYCYVRYVENGQAIGGRYTFQLGYDRKLNIKKENNTYSFFVNEGGSPEGISFTITSNINLNNYDKNIHLGNANFSYSSVVLSGQELTDLTSGISLNADGIAYQVPSAKPTVWSSVYAEKANNNATWLVKYRTSDDGSIYSAWNIVDIGSETGTTSSIFQFAIYLTNAQETADFNNVLVYFLGSSLTLQLVNLSDQTVLEALQDFALISGYEFGVDRQGRFFFRPRVASTTPTHVLDKNELIKVDSVKKDFGNFFTKLTLSFAEIPLEFYANSGDRPTPVDRYGVINKDIDKPDIVNYDNPELAQAIGPQLLEVYAAFPNVIQCTAALNLSVELGDIVNLKREQPLTANPERTEYTKYDELTTYYRACKITGINYNLAKRQMTYTLRDVTNPNTEPQYEFEEYIYDFPVKLGVKE